MTAIIDAQDLARYLKRAIVADSAEALAADEIIDGLEADLETYLKRPLVPTTVTDEVVSVNRDGRIFLKATPVVSVTTFTVDGTAVDVAQYAVETWGINDVWPGFLPSPLISPEPALLATYVGGLPGDDPTSAFARKARATLLRAAARDYNQVVREDLAGVSRASVEGTSLEFHGGVRAGAGGLTDAEMESFKKWKRRTVRR